MEIDEGTLVPQETAKRQSYFPEIPLFPVLVPPLPKGLATPQCTCKKPLASHSLEVDANVIITSNVE